MHNRQNAQKWCLGTISLGTKRTVRFFCLMCSSSFRGINVLFGARNVCNMCLLVREMRAIFIVALKRRLCDICMRKPLTWNEEEHKFFKI